MTAWLPCTFAEKLLALIKCKLHIYTGFFQAKMIPYVVFCSFTAGKGQERHRNFRWRWGRMDDWVSRAALFSKNYKQAYKYITNSEKSFKMKSTLLR